MPIEITMPRLSDTMEEGTLIKWRVGVGDKVGNGDILADIETDKATMELQAYDDGIVALLDTQQGQTTPVGQRILLLAEEGESVQEAIQAAGGAQDTEKQSNSPSATTPPSGSADQAPQNTGAGHPPPDTNQRVRVSPLARKLAEEHGVDINTIRGSGPDGRIIKRDILTASGASGVSGGGADDKAPSDARTGPAPIEAPQTVPKTNATPTTLQSKTLEISNMRRTIARRLVESKTTIPHFATSVVIDMDPLLKLRATLNEQLAASSGSTRGPVKLSVNDFIVKASGVSLAYHAGINSSWTNDGIALHGTVNIGVAVALPEERGGGLVVPTIRDVQNKGLRQISLETRSLAKKAREEGLTLEEMSDGTFTVSNLGMFGIDHFEAIINPPQAAILAVGAAIEKPVVRDGTIVIGHQMTATLSADHRVVDGAMAAQWLRTFQQFLENPAGLLV